ncbi:hypothetical protein CFS9_39470 [Flavobacterium sp. CFS9]|uniref:Lipid A 3-O-deacylase (PagL) n=1 Tax=Flavobacterium sp. CFS9 TaxID=3143118 RepID=A0AAT9H7J0_9FLAO
MLKKILFSLLLSSTSNVLAQDSIPTNSARQRLNFAKTYFEVGGTYIASFKGKKFQGNAITTFDHSASFNQYLTWGGFHFWDHAEFYVNFPLNQLLLDSKAKDSYKLEQSVVTGARVYPWAIQEGKLRPFVGISWGGLDFKQVSNSDESSPQLAKDFLLNVETGLLYNYKNFGLRFAIHYNTDNQWEYPLDKLQKVKIKTPAVSASLGLLYSFDSSKETSKEEANKWNSYPTLGKLSDHATKYGDFFIGVGPSLSFSLSKSDYNQMNLPYLKDRLVSKNYFDIAVGYQFNKANFFTALSFRNPEFQTKGYDTEQTIKKTSLALELNKFLTDYTGFAPYFGINLAYDKLSYRLKTDDITSTIKFKGKLEPGLTFGWDIVPGKTDEALILRTNLRWYPFSKFDVNGQNFSFKQLEYNLIQIVFYPERLKKKANSKSPNQR